MKNILLILNVMLCSIAFSQATLISNDTNLEEGYPINTTSAIFIGDNKLWISDGTEANTIPIEVNVTVQSSSSKAVLNNAMYFSGVDESNDAELWRTDGTAAGTYRVSNIAPDASSSPKSFFLFNNALYFFAFTTSEGYELWKTDGTEPGTILVKDITSGSVGTYHNALSWYIYNNELYFTPASALGIELWKTNGTTGGTIVVSDINMGPSSSNPTFLCIYHDELFFSAEDAANGRELWKTNGSSVSMVKDINTSGNSNISGIVILNDKMLFNAAAQPGNDELWISDGTDNGTVLLKEIYGGSTGSQPDIKNGIIILNKLYFPATSAETGRELFATDGTTGGTLLFKEFNEGATGSNPTIWLDRRYGQNYLMPDDGVNSRLQNGKIYFTVEYDPDNHQNQDLWITDGTLPNTSALSNYFGTFQCCAFGYLSLNYAYTQNALYLNANVDLSNYEPYKVINGTVSMVQDLWPGAHESNPVFRLFIHNGRLFFNANNGYDNDATRDLYVINEAAIPLPVKLESFTGRLNKGLVNLNWVTSNEPAGIRFIIQRSYNGVNFQNIAEVKGIGQGNKQQYSYKDKASNAPVFYRLRVSGEKSDFYSAVLKVDAGTGKPFLYPNPASNHITLQMYNGEAGAYNVDIINYNGQVIQSRTYYLKAGKNQLNLDLRPLAPGSYLISVSTTGKTEIYSFVKQ